MDGWTWLQTNRGHGIYMCVARIGGAQKLLMCVSDGSTSDQIAVVRHLDGWLDMDKTDGTPW